MSGPSVRERKRNRSEQWERSPSLGKDMESSTDKRPARRKVIYLALTAVVCLGIYQFTGFIKLILDPWLQLSEPTLHGVNKDAVPNFAPDVAKRDAVVQAFKNSWLAYEKDAMGDDEYHPIGHKGTNLSSSGGIGYTVLDAIDTMLIMDLDEEAARAREWVKSKLSFDREGDFNTFETTIRILGGLLSAYHFSGEDPLYLEKAVELADRMLPAFDTPSGLPLSSINLAKKKGIPDHSNNGWVSTAEISTLQLEFRYLSYLTDDDVYWKTVEKVMSIIKQNQATPRLVSIFMDPESGHFMTSDIRLGSRGDSFYEYLLKQYLQTDRTEMVYHEMYEEYIDAINKHLVRESTTSHLVYTAELHPEFTPQRELSWRLIPKQDHLVCFLGGSLMLGATTARALVDRVSIPPRASELTLEGKRDWRVGIELIRTCMETHKTATGLSPEIVHFRIPSDGMEMNSMPHDWYIKGARPGAYPPLDARYILRPETVESLFIAFRLTGDEVYRKYGWQIFQAIEEHCKMDTGAYASVINVDEVPARHEDKMETFFLSETLKYLFLLFSDDKIVPLSQYVFNTEAHPLPIFKPSIRTGFT